jgi:hypothetical protein
MLCGTVALLALLPWIGRGQDVSWAVEEAPFTSVVLLKALEKAPAFTAKVEVIVSGKDDPTPSVATGTVMYAVGKLRWDVKLADVKSPQLSQNARAVVRQINGDRFLMFTRSDLRGNYLVLTGANACLHQDLPQLKLTRTKDQARTETIDGLTCTAERWSSARAGGAACTVTTWKAKDRQGVACQIQITDTEQALKVRLKDIQFGRVPDDRFRVPEGLSKYESMEDLVQSVLLDKMKKRLGLQ